MRTYLDKNGIMQVAYRDSKLAEGTFYAASWIDERGNTIVDLLCETCKVANAETYADASIRETVLASDETCHLCGSPEVDRPITLAELSNLYA